MKVLTALSVSLLLCSGIQALELVPTYRENNAKNIAFFATIGGASHYNWVLSIGEELGLRGHNFTFLCSDEEVRFGRNYPNVKTVPTGAQVKFDVKDIVSGSESGTANPMEFLSGIIELTFGNFERDFFFAKEYFIKNNIDVALCDHFGNACVSAAASLNIPYIVTSSMDTTEESSAPYINNKFHSMHEATTEFQSFTTRFTNKFVTPVTSLRYMLPIIRNLSDRKKAIGIDLPMEDPSTEWRNSIKLVNNLHGFQPARPLGPLIEYIGPILPKNYNPLTDELENYLNTHERVAYIAFGQTATPSEKDIRLILTGLLESLEVGMLDGFLWATVHAEGRFPDTITTSSNTTYDIKDMLNQVHPHARLIKWAPQTAVLLHPSTALFVSHGGLGSWYESMYSGTRMIMFPFFGDQPANALITEQSGLGGILKSKFSIEEAVALFKRITSDEDGKIMDNVKRMQALVQIHSQRGIARGADIVEEVIYTNRNGMLPHRESADRRMSFIKGHNLDLYASLVSIVAVGFLSFTVLVMKAWAFYNHYVSSTEKKIKKL